MLGPQQPRAGRRPSLTQVSVLENRAAQRCTARNRSERRSYRGQVSLVECGPRRCLERWTFRWIDSRAPVLRLEERRGNLGRVLHPGSIEIRIRMILEVRIDQHQQVVLSREPGLVHQRPQRVGAPGRARSRRYRSPRLLGAPHPVHANARDVVAAEPHTMVRASPKSAVAACGRRFADIVDSNVLVPSVRPDPFRYADAVPIAERVHRRSDPDEIKTILPARGCRTHRGPTPGVQRPMIHKARKRGDPRSLPSRHPSGKMHCGQRLTAPTRRRGGISRDRRGCDPIDDCAEFPHSGAHRDRARTSLGGGDLSQRVGAQTLPMINSLRGYAECLRPRQLRAVIEVHDGLDVGDFERAQAAAGAIRARPQHQAGVGTAHTRLAGGTAGFWIPAFAGMTVGGRNDGGGPE